MPIEYAIIPSQADEKPGFTAVIRDVSLQKSTLQILTRSEQRYRCLFETSLEAIMTVSLTHGYLSGNPAAIKLFGCRDAMEFLQQTPASLSPLHQPDGGLSSELAVYWIKKALTEGHAHYEWLHLRANGETFFAEVLLSRVDISEEETLQAIVRDISESKRDRASLMTSEARTRAVLHTMSDAVVLMDAQGQILLFNDALCEMFRYEEEELQGKNFNLLIPEPYAVEQNSHLQHLCKFRERSTGNGRVELNGRCKNGQLIPIELTFSELIDDLGATYIGVMRDITQSKAYEASQQAARLEAERLVKVKGDFLANMSHEIRTPLNAIIGLAQMSLRKEPPPDPRENFRRILEAGMHLLNLVDDILDFSKIEAGKMNVDPQPLQLNRLLDNALQLVELRAKEKNLQILVERPDNLPEWVMGDELRIRQIIVNLLSNAVKFTEQGFVSLKINYFVSLKANRIQRKFTFQVADSGIGIGAEHISRLFSAFEQADSSTTRNFGGSGLGLAISRNLAQAMGGDITVKSSLGSGSEFTLTLPLELSPPPAYQNINGGAQSGSRLTGLKILAVEDVEINRLILDDLLQYEGAQTIFAENGLQTLPILKTTVFDIALMDIQMPIMDGHTTARLISKFYPDLPIIGLTAHAMPEERQRCLESGMRERVTKPFEPNILVNAILRHIKKPFQTKTPDPNQPQTISELSPGSSPRIKSSLVDWKAFNLRFDFRRDFIKQLISSGKNGNLQENIARLQQAIAASDLASIQFIAHSVKSVAGVFEAHTLLNIANVSEHAARNLEPNALRLAGDLLQILQDFLSELESYQQ
ncbi:MAG: PAS domain S-box protein [Methylomonas sp.]